MTNINHSLFPEGESDRPPLMKKIRIRMNDLSLKLCKIIDERFQLWDNMVKMDQKDHEENINDMMEILKILSGIYDLTFAKFRSQGINSTIHAYWKKDQSHHFGKLIILPQIELYDYSVVAFGIIAKSVRGHYHRGDIQHKTVTTLKHLMYIMLIDEFQQMEALEKAIIKLS